MRGLVLAAAALGLVASSVNNAEAQATRVGHRVRAQQMYGPRPWAKPRVGYRYLRSRYKRGIDPTRRHRTRTRHISLRRPLTPRVPLAARSLTKRSPVGKRVPSNVKVIGPAPKVKATEPTPKVKATEPTLKVKATEPTLKAKATEPTPKVEATEPTPTLKAPQAPRAPSKR